MGEEAYARATGDDLGDLYGDVLDVWRPWAPDLRGRPSPPATTWPRRPPDAPAAALFAFRAAAG